MGSSLLDLPVSRLQAIQDPPLPWCFAARQAVRLIKNFTTGLSFVIAADETKIAWDEHCLKQEEIPPIVTASIFQITKGPPEIWLALLPESSVVAIFPDEAFSNCVRIGSSISFYLADTIDAKDRPYKTCFKFIEKHVAKSESSIDVGDSHARKEKNEGNVSPTRCQPEEENSQSPVDISKFPGRKEQYAETPSQPRKTDNASSSVELALLPTTQMMFDLSTLNPEAIGLNEPPEAFTLQRVWNERSLSPNWIFANVVEVSTDTECAIRLQDSAMDHTSEQPSVLWKLPPERSLIAELIEPGYQVLIKNPTVQPTGTSFDVFCIPSTVCFYRTSADEKTDAFGTESSSGHSDYEPKRVHKRQRIDPGLAKSHAPVTTKDLKMLSDVKSTSKLVVLSRVVATPTCSEPFVLSVPCEDDITVQVVDLDASHIAQRLAIGDEVLFYNMSWASAISPDGSQIPEGWTASSCEILPIMSGFLYSSFAREITPVKRLSTLSLNNCMQSGSKRISGTWILRVRIEKVSLLKEEKYILVKVTDKFDEKGKSANNEKGSGAKRIHRSRPRPYEDPIPGSSSGEVLTRGRCLEELFRTNNPEAFWTNNPDKLLSDNLERLKSETWLMTVKYSPLLAPSIPEISCCIPVRKFE